MRKIFILAKTLLIGGIGAADKKGKRRWWLAIVLLFAFASFAFSIGVLASGLHDVLNMMGAGEALLPLALGATSIVIFMFGIFYTVSVMYHADDVPMLLSLPLRPYQILGAKFLTLVVYEYIFEAFILLPVLIVYGIKTGAGALFAVYAALIFLILPIIALVMASVLVMLVMRFTRFGKNKQLFNYIGGIIAMVLAIGLNLGIQSFSRGLVSGQMDFDPQQLTVLLSSIFPGIGFASGALISSASVTGLVNLLIFVLCSAIATAIFLGFGQLAYFKGLVGVTEASAKRRLISSQEMGKKVAVASVTKSYVKREMRLLFRSPIAFMNCVLMNFIWPILMLIMLFGSGESLDGMRMLVATMDGGALIAIFVGISAFVSSANAITSTAISREGKALFFMKFIPVRITTQLFAKILTGILLSGVAILMLAVVCLVLGIAPALVLVAFVLGIGAAVVSALIGLMIDAANPKLNWMNEQQAIKQNVNVVLHMLVGLLLAAVILLPVLLLGLPLLPSVLYQIAVVGIGAFLLRLLVSKKAAVKIEQMDV